MKIFNITDPMSLLEVLDKCTGHVDMTDAKGEAVTGAQIRDFCRIARLNDQTIPELWVRFEKPTDCRRMMTYVAQMRSA